MPLSKPGSELFYAIKTNRLDEVVRLLKEDPALILEKDNSEKNIFHQAACYGNVEMFDFLLQQAQAKMSFDKLQNLMASEDNDARTVFDYAEGNRDKDKLGQILNPFLTKTNQPTVRPESYFHVDPQILEEQEFPGLDLAIANSQKESYKTITNMLNSPTQSESKEIAKEQATEQIHGLIDLIFVNLDKSIQMGKKESHLTDPVEINQRFELFTEIKKYYNSMSKLAKNAINDMIEQYPKDGGKYKDCSFDKFIELITGAKVANKIKEAGCLDTATTDLKNILEHFVEFGGYGKERLATIDNASTKNSELSKEDSAEEDKQAFKADEGLNQTSSTINNTFS
jgi:hypothetical protein